MIRRCAGSSAEMEAGMERSRNYRFFFYVLLFFLLSLAGWLWEIAIYLVQDGRFVNRGILLGPWLPVYGSGGLLLILVFSADAAWAADFPNMGEGITARINTVP